MASKKAEAAGPKKMSKSQVVGALSEKTGLSKKDVAGVFANLSELVKRELGKKGPGEFLLPDLLKLKIRAIPAKPKRKGINPFTKEEVTFPAKPASRKVRATALKKLKDMV
jgi:nucleoid DNA-binding protein